jgi:preprotein translocase subunit YajC
MQPEQLFASPLIPFLVVFAVFYFVVIRPQRQREKQHQLMLKELKKNDDVVTTSGIHGTIVNVKDQTVVVRIDDNVKVEMDKSCIVYVKKPESAAATK